VDHADPTMAPSEALWYPRRPEMKFSNISSKMWTISGRHSSLSPTQHLFLTLFCS
jgi:hypothetical protein